MIDPFEFTLSLQRVRSKESQIDGQGVFTQIGFRRGDLICRLQGEKITIPELKVLYDNRILRPSDPLQVSERRYLRLGPPYIYFNHSCTPNAAVVREADLIALRPIDAREELTFDYSTTEWTHDRFGRWREWHMPCGCGMPNCRGDISQFPSLPLGLKTEYFRRGALPDVILRKIVRAGLAYNGN